MSWRLKPVCLSLCISALIKIHLFLCLFHHSVYISNQLSVNLTVCLPVQTSSNPFIRTLSVCPSVFNSVCLMFCLSVTLSVRVSICPSVNSCISLSICQFVCLSIHLSTYPLVCLPVRLSICLSVRLSFCLSVCIAIH